MCHANEGESVQIVTVIKELNMERKLREASEGASRELSKIMSELGRRGNANRTFEQRSAAAKKGAETKRAKREAKEL